jgi:ubiquitin C
MQIFFKTEKAPTSLTSLEVESSDTIDELKRQISANIHVPVGQIRVIHSGRQMSDGLTLEDYNIQQDALIYVVFRLRGIQIFVNTLL